MSQADLDKWQARYAKDDGAPTPPEPFVTEALAQLPRAGRALDVAGGLGRHALALAAHGLQATLLDISPRGLERAHARAAERGLALETLALDLEAAPFPAGPFDVIVVAWFLLPEATWPALARALAPGGHLLYVHPTHENLERHPRPSARFLIAPGDLRARAAQVGLEVVAHEVGWDPRAHHTERLWARRPASP